MRNGPFVGARRILDRLCFEAFLFKSMIFCVLPIENYTKLSFNNFMWVCSERHVKLPTRVVSWIKKATTRFMLASLATFNRFSTISTLSIPSRSFHFISLLSQRRFQKHPLFLIWWVLLLLSNLSNYLHKLRGSLSLMLCIPLTNVMYYPKEKGHIRSYMCYDNKNTYINTPIFLLGCWIKTTFSR